MTDPVDANFDNASWRTGHRERLREKFLAQKLVDNEIVELLLCYLIPRRDVRPLARQLMATFGGVHQILTAPIDSLVQIPGIKLNTAIFFKVIQEILLMNYREHLNKETVFHDISQLSSYCRTMMMGKSVEEFHVLYLSGDYKLLADDTHSVGTVDFAQVYPREIVHRALNLKARAVVLLHNHPTAGTSFSTPDIEMTTKIRDILSPIGVELFDHLLVAGSIVYSARNLHFL